MNTFIEDILLGNDLYWTMLAPVCGKHSMTHIEILILLFLAKNPRQNTATDIVKSRRLTKSSVSVAVRTLQERGLIAGEFEDGNHRSIHLNLCEAAKPIIEDAEAAQQNYYAVLSAGFSENEIESFKRYMERISHNVRTYYTEHE